MSWWGVWVGANVVNVLLLTTSTILFIDKLHVAIHVRRRPVHSEASRILRVRGVWVNAIMLVALMIFLAMGLGLLIVAFELESHAGVQWWVGVFTGAFAVAALVILVAVWVDLMITGEADKAAEAEHARNNLGPSPDHVGGSPSDNSVNRRNPI